MAYMLFRPIVITLIFMFSLCSFASIKENITVNNNTDKFIIIQETVSRQISSSPHRFTINPYSTKSWKISINPLSKINEWFYEFTISLASTTSGSDAFLFSVFSQDVEGFSIPYAPNLPYSLSGHWVDLDDDSYSIMLELNN